MRFPSSAEAYIASQNMTKASANTLTTLQPVVFSLELLYSLRGMPVPLAASAVGMSVTAFKKACRSLGVSRGGYRRGPGRSGGKKDAALTRPAEASPLSNLGAGLSLSLGSGSGLRCRASSSAGEEVDVQLAGVGRVEWGCELMDWLGNGATGAGATADGSDDALVLEMLARAWPHSVDPAVSASAKPARLSGSENLS